MIANFRICPFLHFGLIVLSSTIGHLVAQDSTPIVMELDGKAVLNSNADKVGIWVNSNVDRNDQSFVEALRGLKMRSIRYGWQFGLFDPNDLSSQIHSPRNAKSQGYMANAEGRLIENFGPGGVNEMLEKIDAVGFAVLSTDGINYIGKEDPRVAAMSREARIEAYAKKSVQWATWANKGRFQYFEIGNENDMTGLATGEPVGIANGRRHSIARGRIDRGNRFE